MSPLEAIRAVYASPLPLTDKAVLVAWCTHLDSSSLSAHCGPALLAKETGASRKTIKRVLSALRSAGVLVRVGTKDTQAGSFQIDRLDLDALSVLEGGIRETPGTERPQGQRVPTPGDRESLPPGTESPPMEANKEAKKEIRSPPLSPPAGGAFDEGQVVWILARWGGDVLRVSSSTVEQALRDARPGCSRKRRTVAASLHEARRRWPRTAAEQLAQAQARTSTFESWRAEVGDLAALLPEPELRSLWEAERSGLDPPGAG